MGVSPVPTPRISVCRNFVCLALATYAAFLAAQTAPPTSFAISENLTGLAPGATTTIYRSDSRVLMDARVPAQNGSPATRSLTLYDLQAQTSVSWDPNANPPACGGVGTFSGDWGNPFDLTSQVAPGIASGDLKPAGTETINGIATQVYAGSTGGSAIKVWFDAKDGLVIRAVASMPNGAPLTMADITKVSIGPQPASLFVLPPVCVGVKPPPSASDLIAGETGDDAANYVNGMYGPGSKNNCSVVLRVVNAKTMTPITKIQVAIDTSVYPDNAPPSFTFGVRDDGSQSYSGGHVMEITNRAHNGVVRLGLPPDRFYLSVNLIQPGRGGGMGLVYRQCFAPTTVLLEVVKDYLQPDESSDLLWVKSGKYATPPAQ
jgi:hypothetical protein